MTIISSSNPLKLPMTIATNLNDVTIFCSTLSANELTTKKVDCVGDLPRVLRTPYTFNYKLGADNAPMCHIVEDSGLRFSPNQIDEKLNTLVPTTIESQIEITKTFNAQQTPNENCEFVDDNPDFKEFRIRHMLDFINPSTLTYDEWLAVGMILKNIGCDCSDWEILALRR